MVGYSMSGSEEIGRNRTATRPTSTSAIINKEVATGLNTNRREMFMGCASAVAADQPLEGALAPCAGAPGLFFLCAAGVVGAAPPAVPAPAMLILAPSLSRSVPSMTTVSLTMSPDRMAVFLPSLGPKVTLRTDTV